MIMKILVTGAAGFIGYHLVRSLLGCGHNVVGLDNINDYYDVNLKYSRLHECGIERDEIVYGEIVQSTSYPEYRFVKLDLSDKTSLPRLFAEERFDKVCNLAAQAGVRYSIENPWAYVDSNLVGFANILECCRHNGIKHLVYASSSSVYGANEKVPFSEDDKVDEPVSLYAATKKANELMAAAYSKLYAIPVTGLRFFTVYGPWGRPDMSPVLFADAIMSCKPIKVFNGGDMSRDFTYIDDIVEGVVRVLVACEKPAVSALVYNIGCGSPVRLMDFIATMESAFGRKAELEMLPMQKGDVPRTFADTTHLERDFGYKPHISLEEGIAEFAKWYREYYG